MSGTHVEERLSSYIDNMLAPYEKSYVEHHLRDCEECRQILTDLKSLVRFVKSVSKPSPRSGLEARLLARLNEGPPRKSTKFKWVPISGGLVIVLVSLFIFVMIKENQFDQQVSRFQVDRLASLEKDKSNMAETPAPIQKELKTIGQVLPSNSSTIAPEKPDLHTRGRRNEVASNKLRAFLPKMEERSNLVQRKGLSEGAEKTQAAKAESQFGVNSEMVGQKMKSVEPLKKSSPQEVGTIGGEEKVANEKEELVSDFKSVPPLEQAGMMCQITKPEQLIIRSKSDWEALLNRMGGQTSSSLFPTVDFSKQMIAAVFMGEQPSAGYSIRMVSEEFRNQPPWQILIIKFRKSSPSPDTFMATVITQPYHLKVLSLFQGSVQFQEEK